MKWLLSLSISFLFIAFYSCNNSGNQDKTDIDTSMKLPRDTMADQMNADTSSKPYVNHAQAVLAETQADTVLTGNATFDSTAGGKVRMVIEITVPKMAGKSVAVHLHEHGDCGDKGMLAHGHWNPTNKPHGKWGAGEFHLGDIGNITLDSKGQGKLTMETDLWTLGGPNQTNIIGKSVIVHSGSDDYKTQPTGNAGSRIGCGVIQ